ncbi:type II toxin-antitoxin system RelE/ParE family toxin [Sandarakinorhabdus sp.]|uniref:type II toxin-antitoxin system RelE/ParE family toxin n=1 Tax=Sandarakinorhabdus sp. TaxID=1916663 RepID=UPI00286D7E81|nr:type II toxin-antitoxin system RelE/ParE family toxin [Sandarakinorhabdus sp.]
MAEVRLSPRAQNDLEGLFDDTVARWGLAQAMRYTDLIEAACTALAAAPYQAPACDHISPGYRRRAVEQHMIYFRVLDDGIAVIRILHQRMDAPRQL